MKKAIVSLVTLILSVALVGCGKTNKGADEAVGVYRGTGAKMELLRYEYFVVTAEGSVYTLEHVRNPGENYYNRNYKSELTKLVYSFDGKKLESGDLQGEKVGEENALPAEIHTLNRVNERARVLRKHLLAKSLELEVRLVQSRLGFSETQVKHLDVLIAQRDKLVEFLKRRGLKQFWVSDYSNTDYYELGDRLNLPSGITRDPSRALEVLK